MSDSLKLRNYMESKTRKCKKCKTELPLTSFQKDREIFCKKQGKAYPYTQWKCKKCNAAYYRELYPKRRAYVIANVKQWRIRNRERLNRAIRDLNRRKRMESIEAYGGICACCGEARIEFLTLDHIKPCGRAGRVQTHVIINRLKKQGWPKGEFQILCFNCNCAKGIYGACPHMVDAKLVPMTTRKRNGLTPLAPAFWDVDSSFF